MYVQDLNVRLASLAATANRRNPRLDIIQDRNDTCGRSKRPTYKGNDWKAEASRRGTQQVLRTPNDQSMQVR
jgi:hypothetical protein